MDKEKEDLETVVPSGTEGRKKQHRLFSLSTHSYIKILYKPYFFDIITLKAKSKINHRFIKPGVNRYG